MMKMINKISMGPIPETGIGLYVHIPFCVRKCAYCDFLSFPCDAQGQEAYVDALCREILTLKQVPLRTLYIGGGTPSILPEALIGRICDTIRSTCQILPKAEWTIECNPATFDLAKARFWRTLGMNRVSMGVQSLDDRLLQRIGRIHSAEDARQGFQTLRAAGFENISIDLMMGLPEQTMEDWMSTLTEAVSWGPEHISCYSLIVEEGTRLYDEDEKGLLNLPDEETERAMYHETVTYLKEHGLPQYEISNFGKPDRESRHNTSYWERIPYIGLGLGAASLIADQRLREPVEMKEYLSGKEPVIEEELTLEEQMKETMLLGLRMNRGVSKEDFQDRFGVSMEQVFSGELKELKTSGLLESCEERIFLTSKGRDLANQVFVRFV